MKSVGDYDKTSQKSIYEFAHKLTGKSLSEVVDLPIDISNAKNRGDLGTLIEKYYFKHKPENLNHQPDFPEAGIELKTTGIKLTKSGDYVAKERLVLMMIDFEKIVKEQWETSSYLKKCRLMLLMFYLYSKEVDVIDRKFVLPPMLFEIPAADLNIIKKDWEIIREKVLKGQADQLSEGDTFYLGACRKGSGGEKEKLRKQPFSDSGAPARAFSLKQGYLNRIIKNHISGNFDSDGVLGTDIEKTTALKFEKYLGKTIEEISDSVGYHKRGLIHKGFNQDLARRILSDSRLDVPELEKANIKLKTVRLNIHEKCQESMSFRGFKFLDLVNQEWEDSIFCEELEQKLLLFVTKLDENKKERLYKIAYWNMPFEDRLEAKRVWEETKKRIKIDATNLPKISESKIAHVRPKARNGKDKIITPQGTMQLKQCFWLNAQYLTEVINKLP